MEYSGGSAYQGAAPWHRMWGRDTKGSGPDITLVASLGPLFYVPGGLVFVDSARVSAGYESQHLATNSRNIRYHTPLYGGV